MLRPPLLDPAATSRKRRRSRPWLVLSLLLLLLLLLLRLRGRGGGDGEDDGGEEYGGAGDLMEGELLAEDGSGPAGAEGRGEREPELRLRGRRASLGPRLEEGRACAREERRREEKSRLWLRVKGGGSREGRSASGIRFGASFVLVDKAKEHCRATAVVFLASFLSLSLSL